MAKYPIKIDKLKVGELITEPFDYEISFDYADEYSDIRESFIKKHL